MVPCAIVSRMITENLSSLSLILDKLSTFKKIKGKDDNFCITWYIYDGRLYQQ